MASDELSRKASQRFTNMSASESLYGFLDQHGITFERYDHPPVYTCDEADLHVPALAAAKTKNLFLRDKKGRNHFLVAVSPSKSVDVKALAKLLGVNGLSFGSSDRLQKYLGIEPGSVSLLAAINDTDGVVSVVVDADLWANDSIQCHPLVNTSTLVLARLELDNFLGLTGHPVQIIDVPSRES